MAIRWIVLLLLLNVSPTSIAQSIQSQKQAFSNLHQDSKQAIPMGQRLYEVAVRSNDWRGASDCANQLAAVYCRLGTSRFKAGSYPQGISSALTGLRWLAKSRSAPDTLRFQLLSLAAASYGRIPLADSATHWYTQTGAYLTSHPRLRRIIPDDVCGYYMGHANFLSRTGDSQRAFDYLQIAADLAHKTRNRRLPAIINNYTGNYFFQMRQFDRADAYYRKALHGYEAGTVDQCWGYVILGNNDRMAGRPATGLANLQRGQQLYKQRIARQLRDRNVDLEIQASYYSAECRRALGQLDGAAQAYRTCLKLHQQQYGARGEFMAYSWLGLGHIARHRSNRRRALALAQRAALTSCYRLDAQASPTDYVGTVVNEKTLYESLRLEADLWWDDWVSQRSQSALTNAVQRYDLALTIAARLRRNLVPEESKFFLSANVAPCVERAIGGCYELWRQTGREPDRNRLFALMERHRTMTTSDVLHEKYRMAQAVPPSIVRREQRLREQKLDLEKAAADFPANGLPDSLRYRLHAVKVVSYQFLDSLERVYPRYYALKYATHPVSVAGVQQRLPARAGYLAYFVSDQYAIGFLITQTGSHVFRVQLPRRFTGTVNQLWQAIRRDPGMFRYTGQQPAADLYGWLIRPVASHLRPLQRLVVARDGPLHYVPFDLLTPTATSTDYVGERVAISYGYSAELTFAPQGDSPTRPPRVAGYAPYDGSKPVNSTDSLSPLRGSPAEVRAWGGRAFMGQEATKGAFLRTVPQSDVVVLATHARADEQRPERSYVAFHPGPTDSRLRAVEIANLPLARLKLVVLSACEGNAGALQRGEGLLSLARAFRLAGCRTILTTSWPAADESTAALNELFQRYAARGLPTDLALQQARSDFRTDKRFRRWNHPYHWANFALIGTPTTIYPEPGLPTEAIWAGGFALLWLALAAWLLGRWLRLSKPRQAL